VIESTLERSVACTVCAKINKTLEILVLLYILDAVYPDTENYPMASKKKSSKKKASRKGAKKPAKKKAKRKAGKKKKRTARKKR
jgi:hypothetical protein